MIPRTTERPNCIALQSVEGRYDEGRAESDEVIGPGHLIEIINDQTNLQQLPPIVRKHSTSGGVGPWRIALEDRLGNAPGSILGRTILTLYDEDDIVPYVIPKSGDVFNVRTNPKAVLTIGTKLQSGGNGRMVLRTGSNIAVAEVEEDVNYTTKPSGVTQGVWDAQEQFVRVRII